MEDPNHEQLARLERKVNILLMVAAVQSVVIVLLVVGMFVSKFLTSLLPTTLLVIVVVAFVVLFRKQIPGWFGNFSRFVFAKMLGSQKSGSMKDIS